MLLYRPCPNVLLAVLTIAPWSSCGLKKGGPVSSESGARVYELICHSPDITKHVGDRLQMSEFECVINGDPTIVGLADGRSLRVTGSNAAETGIVDGHKIGSSFPGGGRISPPLLAGKWSFSVWLGTEDGEGDISSKQNLTLTVHPDPLTGDYTLTQPYLDNQCRVLVDFKLKLALTGDGARSYVDAESAEANSSIDEWTSLLAAEQITLEETSFSSVLSGGLSFAADHASLVEADVDGEIPFGFNFRVSPAYGTSDSFSFPDQSHTIRRERGYTLPQLPKTFTTASEIAVDGRQPSIADDSFCGGASCAGDYLQLSVADNYVCAKLADGVHCWGTSEHGRMGRGGDPTDFAVLEPGKMNDTDGGTVMISSGITGSCVVSHENSLYCTGSNAEGAHFRPDAGAVSTLTPGALSVEGSINYTGRVLAVSVSPYASTSCILTDDGHISCAGAGVDGILGDRTSSANSFDGVRVKKSSGALLDNMRSISVGGAVACGLRDNAGMGEVWCWGDNTIGLLAQNNLDEIVHPAKVQSLAARPVRVTTGMLHACAILENGRVQCWGSGALGALGGGEAVDGASPVPVTVKLDGEPLEGVTYMSLGTLTSCFIFGHDNRLACTGANNYGQLGVGDKVDRSEATEVLAPNGVDKLTGVMLVVAGAYHTCIVTEDEAVYCVGFHPDGVIHKDDDGDYPQDDVTSIDPNHAGELAGRRCRLYGIKP